MVFHGFSYISHYQRGKLQAPARPRLFVRFVVVEVRLQVRLVLGLLRHQGQVGVAFLRRILALKMMYVCVCV